MQNPTVNEMIYSQLNHFLGKSTDANGQISFEKLLEIATWTGAYVIRQRHIQTNNVSQEEIQTVLGSIGNFCKENFGDSFTQEDFELVSSQTLELLKKPTFDSDSREYFGQFYR